MRICHLQDTATHRLGIRQPQNQVAAQLKRESHGQVRLLSAESAYAYAFLKSVMHDITAS